MLEPPSAVITMKLARLLESGLHEEVACNLLSIDHEDYIAWCRAAEQGEYGYEEFQIQVALAVAKAEKEALEAIRKGRPQWQSVAWFLERRFPQRWAKTMRMEATQEVSYTKRLIIQAPEGMAPLPGIETSGGELPPSMPPPPEIE